MVTQLLPILSLVLGMTASEWAAVMTVVIGTGGASTLATGYVAIKKFRQEQAAMTRTVAAEETERAVVTLSGAMQRLETEVTVVRRQAAECDRRWRDHLEVCPMFAGWGPRD